MAKGKKTAPRGKGASGPRAGRSGRGQAPARGRAGQGGGGPYRGRGAASRGGQDRGPSRSGQRKDPRRPQTVYIEGRRAVAEALETGLPLKRALVQGGADSSDATLRRLVQRLQSEDVPIDYVPKARLEAMSSHGAHQGIMVQSMPYQYADLADVIRAAGEGDALVVLLDHVTDEGNFGAIVRSAEVVGAAGVVIANARAASVGSASYKTSAGAVLHIPIAQVPNLAAAIDQLKEAGFWVAGATEHAREDVWSAPIEGRLCLVMGSEGSGISQLVRKKCDFECRLPQRGRVESLNVAQATTVMCYEWLRRVQAREAAQAGAAHADGSDQAASHG